MLTSTIWLIVFSALGVFLLVIGLNNLKSSRAQNLNKNKLRYEAVSRQIAKRWLAGNQEMRITQDIQELDKLHRQLSNSKSQLISTPAAAHKITINWLAHQRALLKADDFFPEFSEETEKDLAMNTE